MVTDYPNQFNTRCHVTHFDENNIRTRLGDFPDLQVAYLIIKNVIDDPPWFMLSWDETVRQLRENHLDNGAGLDVATHGYESYSIFYDDD